MLPRLKDTHLRILKLLSGMQEKDRYGLIIYERLSEMADFNGSRSSVYGALEDLEDAGLIASEWGEATAERGGRRKRIYTISGHAARLLEEQVSSLKSIIGQLKPEGAN